MDINTLIALIILALFVPFPFLGPSIALIAGLFMYKQKGAGIVITVACVMLIIHLMIFVIPHYVTA